MQKNLFREMKFILIISTLKELVSYFTPNAKHSGSFILNINLFTQ